MDYEEIMNKLRSTAEKRYWSCNNRINQADVAAQLGISQSAVSQSMNNDNIRLRRLLELCDVYDLQLVIERKPGANS